jgi:hypothetical protein
MSLRTHLGTLAALLAVGSCSAPTHYSLVSSGDELKYLVTQQAPDHWTESGFDDSKWSVTTGSIGPLAAPDGGDAPLVLVRRLFDVGPEFDLYQSLALKLSVAGSSYTAYVNGQAMAQAGTSPAKMTLPAGLLKPSENVLAVEVHPAPGTTTLSVSAQLTGAEEKATADPNVNVVKGPYLLRPDATGVLIEWETDVATPSKAVVDGKEYDGGACTHHEARISALAPSKAYTYYVQSGDYKSEESSLTTAAGPGERVRFVVYGDNRTNGDAHRRVVEGIEAEGPDFVLNTGDLIDSSNTPEWQAFFDIEYRLLLHTPIYPTLGNHEADSGGAGRFAQLFPLGTKDKFGGRVYSADFGDVHIAVLDSNQDFSPQATWLDADLTAAEARGAKHLFVVMHHGPYSGGRMLLHGSNGEAREHIVPVARKHHVDAMFGGHDHFYERGDASGLVYFVTGGGGAPLHPAGTIAETKYAWSHNHYLVVDVAGPQVHYTAKDPTGVAFDQLETTVTR